MSSTASKVEGLLLFDIDGTLMRSRHLGRRALERSFEELYGWRGALSGLHLDGMIDTQIVAQVCRVRGPVLLDWPSFCETYLRHLKAVSQSPETEAWALPGVVEILDWLDQQPQLKRALLTGNMAEAAKQKLSLVNLHQRFADGAFGDDAERREDLLPVAWRRLGLDMGTPTLIIGDTPADIRVAHAHEVQVLAVATGSRYGFDDLAACKPDWCLKDLSDLQVFQDIVEQWMSRFGGEKSA